MASPVLMDARALQTADSVRGVGRYVSGLLGGLAESGWAARVELLLDPALPAPALPGAFKVHEVRRRYRGRFAAYEDAAVLGQDLDRIGPALFHAPWLRLPSRAPCPVVVTLHDLIPWAWGGPWMAAERMRYWPAKRLLPRAEAVIAVSESMAAEAIHLGRVREDRVTVIAEGVEPGFGAATPGAAERVAARWGLERKFLLFVGALDRRKDPVGLVRAWREAQRAGFDGDLVIAGRQRDAGRLGGARLLGYVTDAELADLYAAAACLVFSSRYEGFGLPVVEAFAAGCPVACYRNSSLPEVAGDAAVMVPDGDARALGRAAAELAADPARAAELAAHGRRRAARYTWKRTAEATAKVYRTLMRPQAGR